MAYAIKVTTDNEVIIGPVIRPDNPNHNCNNPVILKSISAALKRLNRTFEFYKFELLFVNQN